MNDLRTDASTTFNLWKNNSSFQFDPQIKLVDPQIKVFDESGKIKDISLDVSMVSEVLPLHTSTGAHFFLMGSFMANPTGLYVARNAQAKGWYASQYEINVYPIGQSENPLFQLILSEPYTATNSTSVSFSDSTSMGANVGFFGQTPTADVSYNYSISHSRSFNLPDVQILNQSKSHTNNARWIFQMPEVRLNGKALDEPKPIQTSTIQPAFSAYWHWDKPLGESINFRVEITARMMATQVVEEELTENVSIWENIGSLLPIPSAIIWTKRYLDPAVHKINAEGVLTGSYELNVNIPKIGS
jgi:hypothetical protein